MFRTSGSRLYCDRTRASYEPPCSTTSTLANKQLCAVRTALKIPPILENISYSHNFLKIVSLLVRAFGYIKYIYVPRMRGVTKGRSRYANHIDSGIIKPSVKLVPSNICL